MSSDSFSRYRTGLFALFVLVCVLLTVYLRLDFYPDTYYGDEEIPIAVVQHMETNDSLDTNWAKGIWRKAGDRWAYSYDQYNFSSYNSSQYYLNRLFSSTGLNSNPAVFNRLCAVAFQILALVVIAYASLYLAGMYGAIAASLFFVVNPLLVVDAHYARPESFLILITALAIFFHLFASKHKQLNYFFASAFLWGIACTCKFSILPMALLSFLHLLLPPRVQVAAWPYKKIPVSLAWLLCFVGGAFVLAPYMFIHIDKVAHGVLALFQQYLGATSVDALRFERSDLLLPKYLLGYFGAAFWIVIMLSPLHHNKHLKCLAVFLLAITGFYIAVFSCLAFFNESNLSHLAAVWCLLLAIAVETCVSRAREKTRYLKSFYIIIITAIIATPLLCSLKIKFGVYNPDARQRVQSNVENFENQLLVAQPGSHMIDAIALPDPACTKGDPTVIVKLPWAERTELQQFILSLSERGYVLMDEIKLPLNELPHSQLQLLHFPASYRYYQCKNTH